MRIPIVCSLLLALVAHDGAAQRGKTAVRVEFELDEPIWASLFSPADLAALEADAAELLAESLGDRLPVLKLTARDSAAYRLVVTLGPRGGAQPNAHQADRGFHARLIAPDSSTATTWWALFRRAAQLGQPFGGGAGLSLDRRFLEHVRVAVQQADVDPLVRDHLSRVPISNDGRIWTPPPGSFGWVVAVERDDLCIALDSGIRVRVLVPSGLSGQARPRLYHGRVDDDFDPAVVFGNSPPPEFAFGRGFFIRPDPPDQPDLDQLSGNAAAMVAAFYVVHFEEDATICDALPSPAEAEAGAGGGT